MTMALQGDRTTPVAAAAAGVALLTGLAGDALLKTDRIGINLWIVSLVFQALLVLLYRRYRLTIPRASFGLLLLSSLFLTSFAWRDSPGLNLLALFASAVAAGLALWLAHGATVSGSLTQYAGGLLRAGAGIAVGALPLVLSDADWSVLRTGAGGSRAARVGKGLALSLLPVVVFGALLAAADPIFGSFYYDLFDFDLDNLALHGAIIGFVSWGAGGMLRELVIPRRDHDAQVSFGGMRWSFTEVMVVLGSVTGVFLAFVAVQLRALFGGDTFVLEQTGLTYAEYARQGFFHMAWAAALVLPLLMFLDWIGRRDNPREEGSFRALAMVLLALLGLVLLSALQRMRIYQQSYGLTELRVYTVAFMAWLAAVMAWFGMTVLGGRRDRFLPGAVALGFLLVVALHLVNPDRMIAAVNLERLARGARLDVAHAVSLSDDAVPVLARALEQVPAADQCALIQRLDRTGDADWRSWNRSRARARDLVESLQERIAQLGASCPKDRQTSEEL